MVFVPPVLLLLLGGVLPVPVLQFETEGYPADVLSPPHPFAERQSPGAGYPVFVCLLVTGKGCVQTAEIVQILQMTGFIQQLLTVMLPMDINQLAAQSL